MTETEDARDDDVLAWTRYRLVLTKQVDGYPDLVADTFVSYVGDLAGEQVMADLRWWIGELMRQIAFRDGARQSRV